MDDRPERKGRWRAKELEDRKEYFSRPEGFEDLPFSGNPVREFVMPLATVVDGVFRHCGTGFVIHPNGLMLTAKHVVQYAQELTGRTSCDLFAVYVSEKPHDDDPSVSIGGPIPVTYFSALDEFDLAVCCLSVPINTVTKERLQLPTVSIRIAPPVKGEKVIAVGYYDAMSDLPTLDNSTGKKTVHYSHLETCTSGEVTAVYPVLRDKGFLRWPCFETSAETRHGLSGGPIFHQGGGVCGVVCSGTPSPLGNGKYSFYGSTIWPCFGIPVKMLNSDGIEETFRLIELAKKGLIGIDGDIDRLQIIENGDGSCQLQLRN